MNEQWFDGKAKFNRIRFTRFGLCWPIRFAKDCQGGTGHDPYFTRYYTIYVGVFWADVEVISYYE